MKFTSNMHLNKEFIFTKDLLVFNALDYQMGFCNEINIYENKVYTNIIFPYVEGAGLLINIEVNYQFDIDFIGDFIIRQISWDEDSCNLHFKYENGEFYMFEPKFENETEEGLLIIEETNEIKKQIKEKEKNKVVIDADFTKEYNDAMEFAF